MEGKGDARRTTKNPRPGRGTRVCKRLTRGASPIRSTALRGAGLTRCRDRNNRGPIPSTLITVAFPARLTGYSLSACSSPVHSTLALALISQQNDQLSEASLRCVLVRFTAFVWHVFNCGDCSIGFAGCQTRDFALRIQFKCGDSFATNLSLGRKTNNRVRELRAFEHKECRNACDVVDARRPLY